MIKCNKTNVKSKHGMSYFCIVLYRQLSMNTNTSDWHPCSNQNRWLFPANAQFEGQLREKAAWASSMLAKYKIHQNSMMMKPVRKTTYIVRPIWTTWQILVGDISLNPALVEAPTLIFFASLAMDQQEFVFSCSSELEVHVHNHQFLRLGMRKQLDWFHLYVVGLPT